MPVPVTLQRYGLSQKEELEMTETAYIYDAIRTPRSKGKPNSALNEVKPDKSCDHAAGGNAAAA